MELLLNLAWLLVAVVSAIGLLRYARNRENSQSFWVMATAMLCVVVLLFPVISMTDDLHAEVFMAEESGKRRVIAPQIEHQLSSLQALAVRLAISVVMLPRITWPAVREAAVPRPLEGTRPERFTRPPPSFVLV